MTWSYIFQPCRLIHHFHGHAFDRSCIFSRFSVFIGLQAIMTTLSGRVEVNLCRLLSRCETMASEHNCQDWRLEKVNMEICSLLIIYAFNDWRYCLDFVSLVKNSNHVCIVDVLFCYIYMAVLWLPNACMGVAVTRWFFSLNKCCCMC